MTGPFIATLTGRARAAYPIIQSGVAQNLSANAIEVSLRAAGVGIRRQTLLDMVRRIRGVETTGAQLQFVGLNRTPDPRRIPEALTKLRRAFSFRVRLRGTDIATGDPFERFVNVALDHPLTRAEIEQIGTSFIFADPERYQIALDEVLLVNGVKSGALGTLL